VDVLVQLSVPPVLAHIAVSKQQASAQHNWLHQAAELFAITATVGGSAVDTAAILTAAVVFHACYTGAEIPDLEDHVGHINSLPTLLEFIPKKAALLHQWLKKTQNIQIGAVQDSINMHIP
jgi:hypothetical protein